MTIKEAIRILFNAGYIVTQSGEVYRLASPLGGDPFEVGAVALVALAARYR